jgi:putative tricarboxylic transport membrane protein
MKASPAEIVLSVGVLGIGIATAIATALLPGEGGYAKIGPNFMPGVVAAGLVACGLWLLVDALRGTWGIPPPEGAFHAPGFVWVSGALAFQMALIGHAGFVLSSAALFAGIARGFGSRRPARDAAAGLLLAALIHLFFVKLLNVNLPAGWLSPLLGGAGI